MRLHITGPDGRKATVNVPESASQEQIESKVLQIKQNWANLSRSAPKTTAPEEDDRIAGPKRPTFADVDLQAREEPYANADQVQFARESMPAMVEADREKTLDALALNEANRNQELGIGAGPSAYGVTGVVAPHLFDKGAAYIDDVLFNATDGATGQPYDEAVRTRRIMRDRNFEENPVQTAVSGAGAALALPAAKLFNSTTRAGFAGNAVATGGGYGVVHGAGEGEGFDEGLQGAAKEGALGATFALALGKLMQGRRPQSRAEQNAIIDAQDVDVRLPEAAATDSYRVQQEAGLLTKMPIAGTRLQKSMNNAIDDVATGIEKRTDILAQQAGRKATGEASEVGSDAVDRLTRWTKETSQEELAKRLIPLEKSINPAATSELVNVSNTVKALRAQDYRAASDISKPAIDSVLEAIQREGGLDYRGLLDLRTNIGTLMNHNLVADAGTAQPAFKRIYGALTKDIRNHVGRHSRNGAASVKQFDDIMSESSKILRLRGEIQKIIGKKGNVNPETLVNQFGGWISDGSRASLSKIIRLQKAGGDELINDLLATHLTRAIRPSGKIGEFSLANFDKVWKGIPDKTKNILSGLQGKKGSNVGVIRDLDKLSRTVDNLQRVLGEINYSKTAYGNILWDKLQGIANAFKGAGNVAVLGTTAGATAASAAAAGTAAAATTAAMPFVVGRYIANTFARPATIRHVDSLLKAGSRLTEAQARGGSIQDHIKNVNIALSRMAADMMQQDEVKASRITRQELEGYLRREFAPQRSGMFDMGHSMAPHVQEPA